MNMTFMHSPLDIANSYVEVGKSKALLPPFKMFLLGIMAGVFIGFAGLASQAVAAVIPEPNLAKLAGAMVFPAGLAMVLIAGSELFTGNNLIIISVLQKEVSVSAMLRNWVIVFAGNFIGAFIIAYLVVLGGTPELFAGKMAETLVNTATAKATLSIGDALIRGILCNFLVCLAVWMSFAAKTVDGKMVALYFPIMIFVLCGFEHSIANIFLIPAGLFTAMEYGIVSEGLTWFGFFVNNLIPVVIGNTIGGAGLVGYVYWLIYLKHTKGVEAAVEDEELDHAEGY